MYNLRMWEDLSLHLNVQAHLYDRNEQVLGTLAHLSHFYSPTNLDITLSGRRDLPGHFVNVEYAIIICNNKVMARLYLGPHDQESTDYRYYAINLDIGETVALSNIHER